MARRYRLREERMETETPGSEIMQIKDNAVDDRAPSPAIEPPAHDATQPSSSSYSASSAAAPKNVQKKKMVQQRLNELKEFLRPHIVSSEINQQKSSTLDTLNQILDLLKSIYPKTQSDVRQLPSRLLSTLNNNSKHFPGFITNEDQDLLNKFGVKFELSQPDGAILNVRLNCLHPTLSWIDSLDLQEKPFSDLIDAEDGQLYFLQLFSIRSCEERSGFLKLKNPLVNVETNSPSIPCKFFAISLTGQDGRKRLQIIVLPLAAVCSVETKLPSANFFTKHSPECKFIDVDNKVVLSWGYLPEEMLGQSFLSFITDESCEVFESSHEQVVKARGKPVRSNAYQFIIRSGKFITMQTEWSLFINPWTKYVDFVIGCHTVIEGSQRYDMFTNVDDRPIKCSEKAQLVQTKITKLLSQPFAQKLKTKQTAVNQKTLKITNKSDSSKNDKQEIKVDDSSSSKDKSPCRHMSTFFDRIVEHEYFMADAPPLQDEFWKKGSPQGSLPASGDGSSGSPPESSGSGPSYNEITRLENVTRLLKSQEGHSSDDSSGEKCIKSSSCSPVDRDGVTSGGTKVNQEPTQNSAILEALCNNPCAQIMHRSQSAAANLDHCRQSAVKLTSEILQTFTKEQERQYKANWKRRFSVELQHVALKRALEPSVDSLCNSQKISRPEVYRPASMPVIAKSNEPFFYNPLTSPVSTWSNSAAPSCLPPAKSNTGSYYRSLGPTPAPPPGKNYQISSAPLPIDGVTVVSEPLSPRQSAFAPLKKQQDPLYPVLNENWNNLQIMQPINLSLRSEMPFQTSVIQTGSDGGNSRTHWLSAPGASASVTLQRMTQTSRLIRETQWSVPTVPRPVPMSEDILLRYQYNSPSNLQDVLQNDQNRLQRPMMNLQMDRIYNENSYYSNQPSTVTSDVSPIREATESLMLLEEI